MKLSVIIVNYNVKYFLKQCLSSVLSSNTMMSDGARLETEVWVVDNNSVDGSVEMVRREFPEVKVIANQENAGFSRANNQALAQAMGDYLLLLNPDTLVENDTLVQCVDFMREHKDCGGLCVKMIDGKGCFLKESKRGFPTPEASFYKITGLIHLFPHSRKIAAYYMGHLPDDEVNEVEIMPGAFLMFSRAVYEQIGGLDESYFMYGEDIDFSWRIRLAGYKNYYFPTTHIIHYKGESTKKGSMNYVYTFYNAMAIFVKKYFTGRNAKLFQALLQVAIWVRATLAGAERVMKKGALPMVDFGVAFGGFVALKALWATFWADNIHYYPSEYTTLIIPLYILVLMGCSWLYGGYDKPVKMSRIVKGMAVGLLLLLAFYSLLDEGQRYSRMLLLVGSVWTLLSNLSIRWVLGWLRVEGFSLRSHGRGALLVIGQSDETQRVSELYSTLGASYSEVIITDNTDGHYLQELIRVEHPEEVVFCGRDVALQLIIRLMAELKTSGVDYKIAPAEGDFVIGSNSILSPDNLYLDDLHTVSSVTCRRSKRLFDLIAALVLIVGSPVLFWFQKRKRTYFAHCLTVLVGRLTWVGYTGRPGVFCPSDIISQATPQLADRLTLRYMRHYTTSTDLAILFHNWNNI